jgi:DnaJ-like protein
MSSQVVIAASHALDVDAVHVESRGARWLRPCLGSSSTAHGGDTVSPMDCLDRIAEQRITEAVVAGAFDDLPGSGRPLELDDLSSLAEELHGAYLLLKAAHVLPEEMELRKELLRLGDLLRACEDAETRATLEGRRQALALRYELLMERRRRR